MSSATLVLMFPAEVSIRLPVEYRFKHYTPEQVEEVCQSIADKLGATTHYLDHANTADRSHYG